MVESVPAAKRLLGDLQNSEWRFHSSILLKKPLLQVDSHFDLKLVDVKKIIIIRKRFLN